MKNVAAIVLVLFGHVESSSSHGPPPPTTTSSSTPRAPSSRDALPPWLSHVDDAFLRKKSDLATARHDAAIETALANFDTDGVARSDEGADFVSALTFDEYDIVAEGFRLPDFHEELGDKSVFVTRRDTPMFAKEECDDVVRKANEYYSSVDEHGVDREWPTLPSGQYYIRGFMIKDGPPEIKEWFLRVAKTRLFEALNRQFPEFCGGVENLVVDNAYMFKYTAAPGLRTEIHSDQGLLSFTFALNSIGEYEGGGTFVEGLARADGGGSPHGNILEMDVGQCTVRPGGIRHGGNPLSSGTRYIIGGFCLHKHRVETVRMLVETPQSADENLERESLEAAVAFNRKCDLPYPKLAHIYENGGDPKTALAVVKECLATANPNSASAAYYLGTMSYRSGDYEKAVECMTICLGVDEKDGDAMQTLYQSHAQLGQQEDEFMILRRLVKTPGVSSRVLANAHTNLGTLCDNVELETEHYLKAIDYDSSRSSTWHSLGSALAEQRKWNEAVAAYKRSIELMDAGSIAKIFESVAGDDGGHEMDRKKETLGCLYRAASQQLRTELATCTSSEPLSKDTIINMLRNKMGDKNYDCLMKLSQAA
ncbi:hypothetical protein ACHAWF_012982 [Thalassiosira exigua]